VHIIDSTFSEHLLVLVWSLTFWPCLTSSNHMLINFQVIRTIIQFTTSYFWEGSCWFTQGKTSVLQGPSSELAWVRHLWPQGNGEGKDACLDNGKVLQWGGFQWRNPPYLCMYETLWGCGFITNLGAGDCLSASPCARPMIGMEWTIVRVSGA